MTQHSIWTQSTGDPATSTHTSPPLLFFSLPFVLAPTPTTPPTPASHLPPGLGGPGRSVKWVGRFGPTSGGSDRFEPGVQWKKLHSAGQFLVVVPAPAPKTKAEAEMSLLL